MLLLEKQVAVLLQVDDNRTVSQICRAAAITYAYGHSCINVFLDSGIVKRDDRRIVLTEKGKQVQDLIFRLRVKIC